MKGSNHKNNKGDDEKFIENLRINNLKKEEVKKRNNKFDSFFMICLTSIIGYFLKYFFNKCCNLLCRTSKNCIKMLIFSFFQCCCNFFHCYDEESEEDYYDCNWCCDYDIENFNKNKEFFCYCYQAKRKQNWCNRFLISDIQKNIFPYMLEYFVLQLMTMAFEKQYLDFEDKKQLLNNTNYVAFNNEYYSAKVLQKENKNNVLKEEDIYNFLTFIGTFFLFFYFTLSFGKIVYLTNFDKNKEKNTGNKKLNFGQISKLSNGILDGTHGILIFDGIYSLIFSSLYLSDSKKEIFKYIYIYLIPILMNKFYYFTLIFYCVSYSDQQKKVDLISGSTLISIYLFIWETIVYFIRNNISLKSLYITQIVFDCLFPCFIVLFMLVIIIILFCANFNCKDLFFFLYCVCAFFLCFGGFWMNENTEKNMENCGCDCNICKDSCCCCFDCLDYLNCFDICACSCCFCCECYDCFGCCSCLYCCGKTCKCYYC